MKIVDYQILSDSRMDELRLKVMAEIANGYVPLGGIGTETSYDSPIYLQAMVKHEETV